MTKLKKLSLQEIEKMVGAICVNDDGELIDIKIIEAKSNKVFSIRPGKYTGVIDVFEVEKVDVEEAE